ncbi:MAG: ATP-binding cassette domain-containing protein [Candidatus Methanomethylophilaceae archaeon]|nr:ATP-binding cassette domain-containing protein [Candidatus Methanomethylophilaceae archaeon]
MEKALELRNVSVVRDGRYILRSVDLDIFKGENVAVIGPNGSGKTTLIKLLRGDIHPYYDEDSPATMRIFGMERWNLFDVRSRMGVVSMDLQNMFRNDTKVYEVICSGFFNSLDVFRNHTVTEEMVSKVHSCAMMMGIDDLLTRDIENLSLGEMRRTLIARAMVTDPDLLVLDEPMTGLDIVMKSKFRAMFDILIEKGVSIVMITHELTDIPASVRRVVMIRDGEVFADGDKEELLTDGKVSELYGEPIKVESANGIYRMHLADDVIQ